MLIKSTVIYTYIVRILIIRHITIISLIIFWIKGCKEWKII